MKVSVEVEGERRRGIFFFSVKAFIVILAISAISMSRDFYLPEHLEWLRFPLTKIGADCQGFLFFRIIIFFR